MSSSPKIQMPSSGGGLVRYFDDAKTRFPLKPQYVVVAIIVVIILEVVLHRVGF